MRESVIARASLPFRKVSCSPGGRGTRRGSPPPRLGWSPVPPGNLAKEMDRDETRFLEKPPTGPRRRYAPKWLSFEKNPPYLPWHQGGKDIIGPGFWIVLSFRPEIFFK